MPTDRLLNILDRVRARGDDQVIPVSLCEVAVEVVAMTGASLMLMAGDLPRGSGSSSGDLSSTLEELQHTLGEGPCVDAYRDDAPVLEPDLARYGVPRWPAFAPPAVAAGARSVFGFPMRVGTVRLGALNLCCDRPGALSADQHADARVIADVAARALLALQAEANPGALADEIEAGIDFRFVVHQAAGVVAAQLNISVAEALVRLRAYAFSHDSLLTEVADDVVARRLRFH